METTPMVLVANLDLSVTDTELFDHLRNLSGREVIWAEVSKHIKTGRSLGEGHACFNDHEDAVHAIASLNSTMLRGRTLCVVRSTYTFNEVGVRLRVVDIDRMENRLKLFFRDFGLIHNVKLYTHTNAQKYGYITFKSLQAAARAATAARSGEFVGDNVYYDGQHLIDPESNELLNPSTFVGVPMKKPSQGIDVYVHNLNVFVSDNDLRNQFSSYGDISFCEVTRKPDLSNGSGCVTFSTRDEADRAIAGMQGRIIRGSRIQVSLEGGGKRSSSEMAPDELERDNKKQKF